MAIRRHLHQNPETAHQEYQTTEYILACLRRHGIRVIDYGLTAGVVAEIGGIVPGPVIALRADIDALPVTEQTDLPYASRIPGKMHACGHDFHTAVVIGAGILLKQLESDLPGTVRLIFQPAEETATGARWIMEHRVLDDVSCIFGLHNKPDLPVGTVGIKAGPLMAGAYGFVVEIQGQGSHAAVPDHSVDPIVTASLVVSALLEVTIRTFDLGVRQAVLKRFEDIVYGVSSALGASASIRWVQGPPPVNNHEGLTDFVRDVVAGTGLRVVEPKPSAAGEDFAFYQQSVPGVFVFVGTSGHYEWHHPQFDLDESALPFTAEFCKELCRLALTRLQFHDPLAFYGEADEEQIFDGP